ncbi:MAG: SUMF1/EgtB/PvdO family nonheme iron enzyme [Thermoguttaceae bacterium]|jgi:formylglycine-generating enzyme required for sulfatase activity
MFHKTMSRALLAAALVVSAVTAQAETITMAMVTVGDPGNAADTTGYGAVGYTFQMGKYDVTTSQYAAFLNAVAQTADPCGLYNSCMTLDLPTVGIAQSGSPGSYSYSVTGTAAGKNNMPMFDVTWGDAARFSNWLQNGQPNAPEGNGTTETGAYTLNGAVTISALMAITRNAGATYFIPSENEWYKSAYYKGGSTNAGYWTYPTQSNTAPINTLPDTGNHANFYDYYDTGNGGYTDPTNYLTPVGAFSASPGPYGTFDQGGDVYQWNETPVSGLFRCLRGGSYYYNTSISLASSSRYLLDPVGQDMNYVGFRVASSAASPEPGGIAMLLAGALAFGIWRLRRNA